MLVAISIPIFTSQLEKAREAVDAANIRSAYAEVMAAALTETVDDTNNEYTVTINTDTITAKGSLKQEKGGWVGTAPAIGSYTLPDTADGNTGWTLTYTKATESIAVAYN